MAEVKLVISGDPAAIKRAVAESAVAMDTLQRSGEALTASTARSTAAADRYIEALKREAIALGAGEEALRRYDMAQLGLSQKAQEQAQAMHRAIDAHKEAEKAADAHGASMERLGKHLGNMINIAATAAATMAGVITGQVIQKTIEAEQSHLRLQATLNATGFAAGKTREQIEKLVAEMSKKTFFDDEKIREAAAALLRFKDISGPAFDQALRLSADLAASMGTDLVSAARQVGSALQDPERGMRMLADAGRNLSSAQRALIKDLIESGQHAEAMQIMLDELTGTIGGTADALNTGMKAATVGVDKAWDDLLKTLGKSDVIGGNLSRLFKSTADVLRDIDDLLTRGLADQLARAAGFAMHIAGAAMIMGGNRFGGLAVQDQAARLGGTSYGQSNRVVGTIDRSGQADAGAAAQALQRDMELVDRLLADIDKAQAKIAERAKTEYARAVQAAEKWISALEHEAAALGKTTAEKKLLAAATVASTLATQKERDELMKRAKVAAEDIRLYEERIAQEKRAQESAKEGEKVLREYNRGLDNQVKALERELEGLERTNEQYGLSRTAIEELTLAKLEHNLATWDAETASDAERKALEKMVDLQRQIVEQARRGDGTRAQTRDLREQASVWNDLGGYADGFISVLQRGGGVLKALLGELRNFGAAALSLFSRRLVLQVGASLTGNAAMAVQASQMGNGTFAGSAMNWAGSAADYGLGAMGITGTVGDFGMGLGGSTVFAPGTAGFAGTMANANLASAGFGGGAMAGAALSGLAGGVAGYAITSMLGSGQRGQQVGMTAGAIGAAIGTAILPGIGTAIGAVLGALVGHFTDPDGLAERRSSFGTAPRGTGYSYSARSPFGTFGTFGDEWFSDDDMGDSMRAFLGIQADRENRYAGFMRRDQRERIEAAINVPREYSFGTEHGGFESTLGQIARDRLSIIGEELVPGLGELVTAFEGTVEELYGFVDGVLSMQQSVREIDAAIMQITGDFTGLVRTQLEDMNNRIDDAQAEWEAAVAAADPADMYAAEQELLAAITERYQTEINMVRQLQAAIDSLQQEAYQFALNIAGRINTVGGSRDIGAIALGRAGELRGTIGGDRNPGRQLGNLGQYVGAIDTWYQTRRSEIERDIQAQAANAQAASAAQQAVYQARISALQTELELTQQWAGVLDRAGQMMDRMRFTGLNPLHALGRLDLAQGASEEAGAAFRAAAGGERATAANRYLDALQRELELLPEALQRPSPEYQARYNAIIAQLAEVEGEARTGEERALALQQQLNLLQGEANAIASATFDVNAAMNAAMEGLNREALGYYTYAEEEGQRLYALQIQQHEEQLEAITGGMDVELFIAQMEREQVARLTQIRDAIEALPERLRELLTQNGSLGPGAGNGEGDGAPGGDVNINVVLRNTRGEILETVKVNLTELMRAGAVS